MTIFNETSTTDALRRWMRPDADRFLRPDWRRFWNAGRENDPLYRFYESIERKYDPAQPRVPVGSPNGGQWTGADGAIGGGSSPENSATGSTVSNSNAETQIAARRVSPARQKECDEQHRQDIFICNAIGTMSCWEQAAFRYSQCLIGGYVPPIYH